MFYLLKIKKSVCATILSESSSTETGPGGTISNKSHLFMFQVRDLVRSQLPLILSLVVLASAAHHFQEQADEERQKFNNITFRSNQTAVPRMQSVHPQRSGQHVRHPRALWLLAFALLIHLLSPEIQRHEDNILPSLSLF